jgi:hypothetical protein
MERTEVLKFVAKTGGIKVESNPEKWLNPSKDILDNIKNNIDKLKSYIGKKITLKMEDKDTFSFLALYGAEDGRMEIEEETIEEKEVLLDRKYIVNISGREFVTMAGLLDVAHKKGLKSIKSEMVLADAERSNYIFKTEVILKNGSSFVSYGDANPNNVGTMIKPHIIRMSETRSIARCLRWATNIGMTSLEELGDKGEHNGNKTSDSD